MSHGYFLNLHTFLGSCRGRHAPLLSKYPGARWLVLGGRGWVGDARGGGPWDVRRAALRRWRPELAQRHIPQRNFVLGSAGTHRCRHSRRRRFLLRLLGAPSAAPSLPVNTGEYEHVEKQEAAADGNGDAQRRRITLVVGRRKAAQKTAPNTATAASREAVARRSGRCKCRGIGWALCGAGRRHVAHRGLGGARGGRLRRRRRHRPLQRLRSDGACNRWAAKLPLQTTNTFVVRTG